MLSGILFRNSPVISESKNKIFTLQLKFNIFAPEDCLDGGHVLKYRQYILILYLTTEIKYKMHQSR